MGIEGGFNNTPAAAYQNDAMRQVLNLGLLGLGGGVAGRSLIGVPNFFRRNVTKPPKPPVRESLVQIPIPLEDDGRLKQADATADPIAGLAKNITRFTGIVPPAGQTPGWQHKLLTGWGGKNMSDMPWAVAAGPAAVAGGLYGGWKLADKVLDWSRDREQTSELDNAKRRYEQALLSNYSKTASADAESNPLDQLADQYEKRASLTGVLGGGALLGAGTLGLASGVGTYNWARGWSESNALEDALKRRQEQLYASNPRPILAAPLPFIPEKDNLKRKSIRELLGTSTSAGEPGIPKAAAAAGQQPLATAANMFAGKYKAQQAAYWRQTQTMLNGGKSPEGEQKDQQPTAPQLPSLVSRPPQPV